MTFTLWKICVLTVFGIPICVWQFSEWLPAHATSKYPLVEGRIINRTEYRHLGGIPATRLTIETSDGKVQVMAKETRHGEDRTSDYVKFHFSGDPAREVFIEGGESPLGVALGLLGLLAGAWITYFVMSKRNPEALKRVVV